MTSGRWRAVGRCLGFAMRWPAIIFTLAASVQGGPAPTLKASYGNAGPMTYRDASGRARGFAVDVLEEAGRRQGVRIEWVFATKPADDALRDGTIDVALTSLITPERRRLFYVSSPWWVSERVALVLADAPIQREQDLAGRKFAANATGADHARELGASEILPAPSARDMAAEVCAGRADAAIVAGMFLRELVHEMPAPCQGKRLRTIDLTRSGEYVLMSRRERAAEIRKLRARIDEITADGTLYRLAMQNPPVSSPQALRSAELIRARLERRTAMIGFTAAAAMVVLFAFYVFRLRSSRRRLRASNAQLARSIAAREEAETALRTSELRLRTLVETSFDWIWEVDAEGRYTYASPNVQGLLGYAPEEIVGRTPFDLMPPGQAKRLRGFFSETAAARRAFTVENVKLHKNGTPLVLETSGVPVLGPDGAFLGFRGTGRDITGRRRLEQWQSAQASISRALASGTRLPEALEVVLAALAGIGEWQFGVVWHAAEPSGTLRCLGLWQSAALGDDKALAASGRDLTVAGQGCIVNTVVANGTVEAGSVAGCPQSCCMAGPAEAAGLAQAVGIPLRSGNRITGAIALWGRQECSLCDGLAEMLLGVGNQVGEFIERNRAQAELRRFVSASPAVLYALKVEAEGLRPTFVSDNLIRLTGHTPQEALSAGWWHEGIHPDDRENVLAAGARLYDLETQTQEFRFRKKDGGYVWISDEKRLLRDEQGRPGEVIGSWSDISGRMQLERQLLQAQKMEAIGSLAGGVAHDFNNLLTVINGYSALSLSMVPAGDEVHGQIEEVLRAGERAAGLTRQLLIFSRRQELRPRLVSLQSIVADMQKMLRRLVAEDIELILLNQCEGKVKADPGQLEQVLMNLAVNAQDAMPHGGSLTIATAERRIAPGHPGVPAGLYAELSVGDTGIGMDPGVQSRIFEPFFTTKEQGKGTGLGLSTVYGIVRQSDGFIEVESTPGKGSDFRVLLPLVGGQSGAEETLQLDSEWNGTETVLLVEDDERVRRVAREALRSRGYQVLEASNAGEALLIADQIAPGKLDLLLTDVVMPRVSGIDLAGRLLRIRPGIKLLFMTGHMNRQVLEGDPLVTGAPCLQKPFTPADLAREVRQVLDSPPTSL